MKLTRRSFVAGTAAGLASAGLANSALAEEITWAKEADVLVVGSGYAGMCAAIEAAQAGCSVTLIDKNVVFGGNSILCAGNAQFGGGNIIQQAAGIADDAERFYDEVYAYGHFRAVPELLHTFVDHSNECVEWMQNDLGIVFNAAVSQNEGHSVPCSLMPAKSDRYPGANGISYWYAMYTKCLELGVELLTEHKCVKLLQNADGAVTGIVVEANGAAANWKANKAVILATGGWKSNVAMRLQYDPRLDEDLNAGGMPYVESTGEMTNEVINIGGGERDMSYGSEFRFKWGTSIYQHWGPVSIENPSSTGVGMSFSSFADVVLVKADGVRFVDENAAKTYPQKPFYEAFLNQTEKPRATWAIVDSAVAESLKWDVSVFENPNIDVKPFLEPSFVAVADTIEELAAKVNLPADQLVKTIESYNAAVEAGVDEEFGKEGMTMAIAQPPFYAVKCQFFAHDQMGGITANTRAQVVLRSGHYGPEPIALDDQPVIPHLYAAGEMVGGYVGEERGHGKISIYMVFGRIAGQNAALETPL